MGGKRRTIRSNGPGGGSGLPRDRRTRRERAPGTARLSEGSGFGGVSENAATWREVGPSEVGQGVGGG